MSRSGSGLFRRRVGPKRADAAAQMRESEGGEVATEGGAAAQGGVGPALLELDVVQDGGRVRGEQVPERGLETTRPGKSNTTRPWE